MTVSERIPAPDSLTDLLEKWHEGDEIRGRVLPLVYNDLRHLAHCLFARERRPGHTLQATDLVGEAYIRLAQGGPFKNRNHFFGAAARIMEWKLLDYARRRKAAIRWGSCERVELDEDTASVQEECCEILTMSMALQQLARLNHRQARLVKLRYFAGLSVQEAACVLHIAVGTAKQDWLKAKKWLRAHLEA
jgi:RNA polymerase sigma-70 factor, ECF subfamily